MGQLEKVRFDLVRYANCWEDADILVKALDVKAGARVLSVASAGDNSFSLLAGDPETVVAVDVSKVQLFLVELKKAAIGTLDHSSFLRFCGFLPAVNRLHTYAILRKELSEAARNYWDARQKSINGGIIFSGRFERYFRIFRQYILPLCHSRKEIEELLRVKSIQEQTTFYENTWNNRRWKLLTGFFFGKLVMGRLGRDPVFLREVNMPVGRYIYERTGAHLSSAMVHANCYDDFILKGNFGKNLPHYAREENYLKIQKNIGKLQVYEGLVEDAVLKYGKFTHFNLSDIFEYMNAEQFEAVAGKIINGSEKPAKLAYWNLMVNRRVSEIFPVEVNHLTGLSGALAARDKCFFYKNFIVEMHEK